MHWHGCRTAIWGHRLRGSRVRLSLGSIVMKAPTATLAFLSGLIGFWAWTGHSYALLLLPLIVWIWSLCQSRLAAFIALFCYYASASRNMPSAAEMFYANELHRVSWYLGVCVWIACSGLLALAWSLAWGMRWKASRLTVLMLLLAVPPIGVIGWANPLTAAGILFPAQGWLGLITQLLLFATIVSFPRPVFFLPFMIASAAAHALAPEPSSNKNWYAIHTQTGGGQSLSDEFQRMTQLQQQVSYTSKLAPRGAVMVLPELVGGDWSHNSMWWQDLKESLKAKEQTILLGARWPNQRKDSGYINGMVRIGASDGEPVLQRVPLPLSMWRPWSKDGATAFWFRPGTTFIAGKKIGHLICYEQILIWPVLMTFAESPELVIAPSNVWWAKKTRIPAIQRVSVEAWARLFGVAVITATNI